MKVLEQKDIDFFYKNGYTIIPNAVPQQNLDRTVDAIWNFLGMDRHNPDDWYRKPLRKIGFVELYHHQSFWDNRQYPRVYQAFCDIWQTEKLWVSIDRACLKPPSNPKYPKWEHKGFIHWDLNPWKPISFNIQGVLCLEDTDENQGGFQCIPGFINDKLREWTQENLEPDKVRIPMKITNLQNFEVKKIPAKAGDLIIWQSQLAHGNGHNVSNKPRLAQYINMFPAEEHNHQLREKRIALWRNSLSELTGFKEQIHQMGKAKQESSSTAQLTELGRKLLGLSLW